MPSSPCSRRGAVDDTRLTGLAGLVLVALGAAACGGSSSDASQLFPDTKADAAANADGNGGGSGYDAGPPSDATLPPPDGDPGVACANGRTNCGGVCVDLKTDPQNCGGCGAACAAPPGGGQAACVAFQCTTKCDPSEHACSGICTSNKSVATCGAACLPCPTPTNGTATCDGTACGAACNSGFHPCGGACASNGSVASCGASSCTACAAPANGSATCDGTSCDFACDPGYHRCGDACASDTSVTACGASCTTCPDPPAGGIASCTAGACGFDCQFGYQKSGASCVAATIPSLALSSALGGKASGTFTLTADLVAPRLEFTDVCPNGTITPTVSPYQIVRVSNPTAQAATVSVWSSKAATTGAVDLDTIMASYAALPSTDASRRACSVGVNDMCSDAADPTECKIQWAGLTKVGNQAVTVPANGSVYVYVASFYAAGSGTAATGDYVLTVRTESLN
jgi:hypothetical protein